MADRRVTQSGKDKDGDITKLCNLSEIWSPVSKAAAIQHIESGTHRYYTQHGSGPRAYVEVYKVGVNKHMRTDPNSTTLDNLDNLPDC